MGFADRVRGLWRSGSTVPQVRPLPDAGGERTIPADVVRDLAFLKLDGKLPGDTGDPLRTSVAVFRCSMLIADAIARLPLRVYRGEEQIAAGTASPAAKLAALIEQPHPLMPTGRFLQTLVLHALVHGHAFVFKDGEKSTRLPEALKLLPPDRVEPVRKSRDIYELDGWRVGGASREQTFIPELVVRIEYAPDPNDPLKGLSPIGIARVTAGADTQAAEYNRAIMRSSGVPPIVLKYSGKGQITPAQKAEYLRQWSERHDGPENANRPAFANGDWDVIKLGMDARDMQFIEGRNWNLDEICRAFNVDPWFLGKHDAGALSRSDAVERRRNLYAGNVVPFATRIAEALSVGIAKPVDKGLTIAFDFDGVEALRDDMTEKLAHARSLRDVGYPVNAVNEKLELGMDEIDGGDVPLVPASLVPLSYATEALGPVEDPATPREPESTGASVAVDAQSTVLNGAQITAAVSIVQAVSSGQMPRDSAVGLLVTLFHVSVAQAEAMLGSAGTGAATQPNVPEGGAVVQVEQPTVTVESAPRTFTLAPHRLRMWRAFVRQSEPIERKMHAALRRDLMRQRARVLAALEGGTRANPDDGDVRRAVKAFDPDDVAAAVKPTVLSSHTTGERTALDDMAIETDAPMKGAAARAQDYYTERFPMLRGVGNYVRSRLEATLADGLEAGENLSDMKDRVRATMNDSVRHARVVARTEVASAMSIARTDTFKRNGVKTLEWLSAGDENVRESHQIDGETITLGDSFSNGLAYPCDPSGPPEECISCRCVATPGQSDTLDAETTDDSEE